MLIRAQVKKAGVFAVVDWFTTGRTHADVCVPSLPERGSGTYELCREGYTGMIDRLTVERHHDRYDITYEGRAFRCLAFILQIAR